MRVCFTLERSLLLICEAGVDLSFRVQDQERGVFETVNEWITDDIKSLTRYTPCVFSEHGLTNLNSKFTSFC